MAGYIAMARVERGRVRTLAWDASHPVDAVEPRAEATSAGMPDAAASIQPDSAVPFRERVDRLRDQLSMVTFYLTDPESWR